MTTLFAISIPMSEAVSLTIAALLTLGIFSFLYKDNPIYKTCEAIFVGISAAYWAVVFFWDNLHKKLYLGLFREDGDTPDYMLLGGAILGVMMLFRLSQKVGWIARWPLAFIVGATAGLYMMLYFVSNGLQLISEMMKSPLKYDAEGAFLMADSIGTVVIVLGVLSGLVYFFFSKEHKGAFGATAKVGIWFLMVTFGASFGYTVMSRMSLLIGRVDFIINWWRQLIG